MDALGPTLDWILQNPATFAWICFGIMSAFVALYRSQERRIKAYAARTETKVDDRLVAILDGVAAVVDVLALLVPHGIGRPRSEDEAG